MAGEPAKSRAVQVGEFYELEVGSDVADSPRFNKDIAPTRVAQRTWNKWHIAALWVGMSICVPTYTLGGVLTTYFGLSVGEALWAIFVANVIVLVPLILNAFGGTKFGIPFPVMLRSSFGIIGSNVPALVRALVACGWFGIQTLFGGTAVHLLLSALFDGWKQLGSVGEVLGFLIFWTANVAVVIRGSESIKRLEAFAAPLLLLRGCGTADLGVAAGFHHGAVRAPGQPSGGRFVPRRTFSRASRRWWVSGRRCRSTFRISAGSPSHRRARSSGRSSACRSRC